MLNPNFFLEHHEFYRQNYIKWKIKNLPTDPRKLLKVYRKQDYSFDWPSENCVQTSNITYWYMQFNSIQFITEWNGIKPTPEIGTCISIEIFN